MKWDDRIGRRLKLHDLHVFIAVAELSNMRKAAERLAISQPSVSKAIADIEHVLGVRLLDRNAQGVELTSYGRALVRRAMGAFDELRQGVKDIEGLADPTVGEVGSDVRRQLRQGCCRPWSTVSLAVSRASWLASKQLMTSRPNFVRYVSAAWISC